VHCVLILKENNINNDRLLQTKLRYTLGYCFYQFFFKSLILLQTKKQKDVERVYNVFFHLNVDDGDNFIFKFVACGLLIYSGTKFLGQNILL